MRLLQRAKNMIKVMKGGRWGYFYDRLPGAQKLFNLTNLLPHPSAYKYILLGGHGVGLTAVKYYLAKCQAKPMEVLSYENFRPFIFWREFDGLVLDKAPLNSGASKILATCTKRVPVYQILRDPISIVKSNVNATMLHTISTIHSQKDANELAFEIVKNISHLMIAFSSQRKLVEHITSDVSYLSMRDIDDSNMPSTMQNFCDRFGYTNCSYDEESVVKGSSFPRCFPYIFTIDGTLFALSTLSRLVDGSSAEIDVSAHIDSKRLQWSHPIHKLESIIVEGHESHPLYLVCAAPPPIKSSSLEQARAKAQSYIESTRALLARAEQLAFTESTLIEALLQAPDIATYLAQRIERECAIIKNDRPDIWEQFSHTHKFCACVDRHTDLIGSRVRDSTIASEKSGF